MASPNIDQIIECVFLEMQKRVKGDFSRLQLQ